MGKNVLVFVERREGETKRPALQALAAARELAATLGGTVDALALGPGAAAEGPLLARHGADRLFHAEAGFLELYAPEAYAACVVEVARAQDAAVVLLGATMLGKDLAPKVAARLGTTCAADLVEVAVDAQGVLSGKRPVYSGKAIARVRVATTGTAVATLRPNAFAAVEQEGRSLEQQAPVEPPLGEDRLRVRVVRLQKAEQQELDVAEASVIVSGGRGLKGPEHFHLIRELASALGGAVGASRAVVDAGWIEHRHQVGQTGKVVSPNLYVACGISGAVQHLAGMSTSKVIVAINKDADAPIFRVADYGIVGDVFEVLPALTKAVRQAQG